MNQVVTTLTLDLPTGKLFIAKKALPAVWAFKFEVSHKINFDSARIA